METLSFEQMENIEGGRNNTDCYWALAGFTFSALGIIGTGGWGAVFAGAGLATSYVSMTMACN